jgi:alanyl-tRNA synthetase
MTERLYYLDSLRRSFEASVLSCDDAGDGRFRVVLDRTAFYPTSGGQPHDTGTLGGAPVVDVVDDDAGVVTHVVVGPVTSGAEVSGEIDWSRRFDHMQQHTGQHILSAAFDRRFAVRTMSFHLGVETATIDLAREVTPDEIGQAEAEANRVVWEDRPVTVRFVSDEEAGSLPLRKEPVRTGRLRIVDVTDFDLSACGGTHVPATGMVGAIAIAGWERFKGATRLTFVCGGRAVRSHARFRNAVTAATRALSVLPEELPGAIERLQSDVKEEGRSVKRLTEELARYRAEEFRAGATAIGPWRGVLTAIPSADAAELKTLAQAIVSAPGMIVVFVGEGRPAPTVIARSSDVTVDAGAWMKRAAAELGGRGGGRPEQAQGGLEADAARVLEYAEQTLKML